MPEIDERLPGGGLAYGAIHEFAGGGAGTIDGAAPALFAAGIAARTKGKIIWALTRPDLFFPALSFGGLGAVVGELVRLPMTASGRLQLAAEKTGTLGLIIRRWRRQTEANDFGNPTAATSRWRISVLPSEPLPVEGVGRPRWLAELMRVKAGESAEWEVGACDREGRVCLLPSVKSSGFLSQANGRFG